jgi:hypothetical protein
MPQAITAFAKKPPARPAVSSIRIHSMIDKNGVAFRSIPSRLPPATQFTALV